MREVPRGRPNQRLQVPSTRRSERSRGPSRPTTTLGVLRRKLDAADRHGEDGLGAAASIENLALAGVGAMRTASGDAAASVPCEQGAAVETTAIEQKYAAQVRGAPASSRVTSNVSRSRQPGRRVGRSDRQELGPSWRFVAGWGDGGLPWLIANSLALAVLDVSPPRRRLHRATLPHNPCLPRSIGSGKGCCSRRADGAPEQRKGFARLEPEQPAVARRRKSGVSRRPPAGALAGPGSSTSAHGATLSAPNSLARRDVDREVDHLQSSHLH